MLSSPSWRISVAACLLLALVCRAPAQGRVDVIDARGQVRPLPNATVQSETLDEVRFLRGDRSETRKTSSVVAIEYGPGSATFEDASAARAAGDLANAANLYTAATRDTDPPWVAAHAWLALADLQLSRGPEHRSAALAAVDEFLKLYPEHRLLPEALLLEARAAAALSDRAAADEAVRRVQQLADSGRITPEWAARAQIQRGELLLEAGQAREAGLAFDAAQQAANGALARLGERTDLEPTLKQLALEARSGAGGALLAGGDVNGARAFFQRLQQESSGDPAVALTAGNGLAEASFQEGQLKAAQFAFAQVAVKGTAHPDQHAKALYFLGRCAESLDEQGLERNGRSRAVEYYKEVSERYPGSRWARLAEQSIP